MPSARSFAFIRTLPENTKGRDFVVGDIHGAYELLMEALETVGFDPAKDRVISVGDLADRGPSSPMALEMLQKPWFHAVRGNHEDMFLTVVKPSGKLRMILAEQQRKNGMDWIFEQSQETLAAMHAAYGELPIAMDVKTDRGTVGFIHAEVPQGMDWQTFKQKLKEGDDDTIQHALWSRDRVRRGDDSGVAGIDRLFSGHSVQEGGATQLSNCFYIDTGGVYRLLSAGKHEMFLTLADIRSDTIAIKGQPENDAREKIVTDVPAKGKPFGKHNRPV